MAMRLLWKEKERSRVRDVQIDNLRVNGRDFQLECAGVLHKILLVPVLMYGCKTMLWKEKERRRIRAVQMDDIRGLLGIRRMWIGSQMHG